MQALRVHDFAAPIQLDELPEPQPGPGEVRVRMHAQGISFFDLLIARGGYQWRPDLPFTVGSEYAGTVDAVGAGVTAWAVGDRVCGALSIGAWAQQVCVPADGLHAVPEGAPLDEAAVLHTPYGTALYALRERGHLQPGETVLVLGALGSIGQAAINPLIPSWPPTNCASPAWTNRRARCFAAGGSSTVRPKPWPFSRRRRACAAAAA